MAVTHVATGALVGGTGADARCQKRSAGHSGEAAADLHHTGAHHPPRSRETGGPERAKGSVYNCAMPPDLLSAITTSEA